MFTFFTIITIFTYIYIEFEYWVYVFSILVGLRVFMYTAFPRCFICDWKTNLNEPLLLTEQYFNRTVDFQLYYKIYFLWTLKHG